MEWDILITRQCHAKKKKVKGKKNALTLCVRQGEMKCHRFPEAENKKSTEMYISLQTLYAPLVITECVVN